MLKRQLKEKNKIGKVQLDIESSEKIPGNRLNAPGMPFREGSKIAQVFSQLNKENQDAFLTYYQNNKGKGGYNIRANNMLKRQLKEKNKIGKVQVEIESSEKIPGNRLNAPGTPFREGSKIANVFSQLNKENQDAFLTYYQNNKGKGGYNIRAENMLKRQLKEKNKTGKVQVEIESSEKIPGNRLNAPGTPFHEGSKIANVFSQLNKENQDAFLTYYQNNKGKGGYNIRAENMLKRQLKEKNKTVKKDKIEVEIDSYKKTPEKRLNAPGTPFREGSKIANVFSQLNKENQDAFLTYFYDNKGKGGYNIKAQNMLIKQRKENEKIKKTEKPQLTIDTNQFDEPVNKEVIKEEKPERILRPRIKVLEKLDLNE